jgi:hypothetical protein
MSGERRIMRECYPELDPTNDARKINDLAYESVKKQWVDDKIWDSKWGKYPGMTWMHEFPSDRQHQSPSSAMDRPKTATALTPNPKGPGNARVKKQTNSKKRASGTRKSARIAETQRKQGGSTKQNLPHIPRQILGAGLDFVRQSEC